MRGKNAGNDATLGIDRLGGSEGPLICAKLAAFKPKSRADAVSKVTSVVIFRSTI